MVSDGKKTVWGGIEFANLAAAGGSRSHAMRAFPGSGTEQPGERAGAKPVKALALVQVDAPVSEKVLAALATIEALLEARSVVL